MGMVPMYDVRSTASRYSSCSTPNTMTHAFRPETNGGVPSQPMNDTRVLYLKQTKVTILPKKILHEDSASMKPPHPEKIVQMVRGLINKLYFSEI